MNKRALAFFFLILPAPALAQGVAITERVEVDRSRTLAHEVVIPAATAEVWSAVSTADGWRTWAVPVAWREGEVLETSYSPDARPGDPSTIRQQLVAILPGRMLVFRSIKAPAGFPHFDSFRRVVHFLELEPVDATHTRVRLTGTGYPDSEAGTQLASFFRGGNRVSLERLRQRFVTGPLDWPAILAAERPN